MEAGCKRDSVGKRVQASNAFSGKAGITDEALMQEYANQGSGAVSSSGGNEAHSFQIPGLKVIDHSFEVPLDHFDAADDTTIKIFVRELSSFTKSYRALPFLLYLQGGPGFEANRPTEASGWLKSACNLFRVILLDQRGTGRSTPITCANLKQQGDAAAQARYLTHFRADSIVADCEVVRQKLVPQGNQGGKWSIIGQSFGGFCCTTYLSFAPYALTEVLMTGGVPPLVTSVNGAEEVYLCTFRRVVTQNEKYYQRFPSDAPIIHRIVKHLAAQPDGGVLLPSGSLLTPRYLQTIGLSGLGGGGGFERMHYLFESAWDGDELSYSFLKNCDNWGAWDTNPLYCLLHEIIYCNGPGAASGWAAQRVRDSAEYAERFDAVAAAEAGAPVMFTGEMVFPWMMDDIAALRPYKEAANLLAESTAWSALYDVAMLENNAVPVACAVYFEDMYVDFNLSQQTLSKVNGARQWISNEFMHSGIRDDGARIFEVLLNLVRGAVPLR